MAFGFGLPPAPPRLEDIARLFESAQMGAPQGFVPPVGASAVAETMQVPLPPARPAFGFGAPQKPEPTRADVPASGAVPIMAPPVPSAPASPAPAAPAAGEPSFFDQLGAGIAQNSDLLTSLGIGLMSQRGIGQGLATGLQLAQNQQTKRAATDLARSEAALKALKYQREVQGENATKTYLLKSGLSEEAASAAIGNPAVLSSVMGQLSQKPSVVEIGGQKHWLKPDEKPSDATLLGPAEGDKESVQLMTRPDGSIIAIDKKTVTGGGASAPGSGFTTVAPGTSKLAAEAAEREELVRSRGEDPNDPRNRDFIKTGRLPREDARELTATDKKMINAAEDELPQIDNTIASLSRAKELNRKTFTGYTADWRAKIGTALPDGVVPDGLADPKTAADTREFGQLMSLEAITAMSQTLKGATTDREMGRFMEILGDPTTPPDIRERTIDRMLTLAQRQKELAQSRINDMRGGTYYRPGGGQGRAGAPAQPGQSAPVASPPPGDAARPQSKADYDALPSGAQYIAPDGSLRTKR